MVFNSFEFGVFFLTVYSLYLLFQRSLPLQNRMLLIASLFFYGWWDWRFLMLMVVTIATDYVLAWAIHQTEDRRRKKAYVLISVAVNLGILGFFKYFNFFSENLFFLLRFFGLEWTVPFFSIVLPVGISFYVFQSLSYIMDVYRGDLVPARRLSDFALFVTFFPQLVAGPIERATHLLPQVTAPRKLSLGAFCEGAYLIGWGLFKKIFIADNLSQFVNPVFASAGPYDGLTVLFALYGFAFQIYCDFSGYSDIARGLGKCMGFDIMINFNLPYFSKTPSEFWQRWHISFSNWLRDYLYIPLGGNRHGTLQTLRNLMLTMFLGGLWHGARWNFVFWGIYNGFLLIIYRMLERKPPLFPVPSSHPFKEGVKIVFFFHLTCLGWLCFRAGSFHQIGAMMHGLLFNFHTPSLKFLVVEVARLGFYTGVLLFVQTFQYLRQDLMWVFKSRFSFRAAFYLVCFYLFIVYGATGGQEFIYFQF